MQQQIPQWRTQGADRELEFFVLIAASGASRANKNWGHS
jgi:hypothetical protein